MSNYMSHEKKLIQDDRTMKTFVRSIVKWINLEGIPAPGSENFDFNDYKDVIMDRVNEWFLCVLCFTDIDYADLMYRWRSELGNLLYEMDNDGYELNRVPLAFFGEEAKKSLELLLYLYIQLHFEELFNTKSEKGQGTEPKNQEPDDQTEKPGKWIETDDDSFQLCRKVKEGVFELYQIQAVTPPGPACDERCFGVAHAIIAVSDINEKDILDMYGYSSLDELKNIYGEDWDGILAECDFEIMAECGDCIITAPYMTWKEAKNFICMLSGLKK